MRARLAVLGPVVLTTTTGADFIVQGEVKVVPIPKHKERVEIQWIVKTGTGDERGRVVQLNEIPAGTLNQYWGDVAVVVATEASKRRQRRHPPPVRPRPPTKCGSQRSSQVGGGKGTRRVRQRSPTSAKPRTCSKRR